ncbi:DNA invertase [Haematobacter missouriensis]|uniref:DNA invertase n=3 Tax=Haematobacter TaxID=366614 RepID=A0A086XUG4_9RHOB|nr:MULTISPECIES: recombinase family protein [Haematobacter]KFI25664.1 DNA invertase [Haematobacter massiliensis]OWJ69603.1 DNA invertase [Haematobacter massiliensis]OWJ74440.1 DNA invertase [Haematobacter genomosp. 1]OWJ74521.1 DNA invertase [Haematobacter missouriensis]OWJ81018.1 DNA invertase [Haematobacter missouriensis]
MSRTFAYVRVSTIQQTIENQVQELETAGFIIPKRRIVSETISGSVPAQQRPMFARLIDRLEESDVLVVTKMDRLGRDAMDVAQTVNLLAEMQVRVHCLALGGSDLTSPAGQFTMAILNAVAQFERELLIERTHAGMARARSQGKIIGRPAKLSAAQKHSIRAELDVGVSVSDLARRYGCSRMTIARCKGNVEP